MRYSLVTLALLTGCASNSPLANRVSLTLDGGKAYVNSMYGWIGVTSEVDARDAEVLREMARLRALIEATRAK